MSLSAFAHGAIVGAVLTSLLFAAGVVAALLLSAEPCRCCGRGGENG